MRHLRTLSVLVGILLLAGQSCFAAPAAPRASSTAKLTEAHGQIFKRGFVDWTRESWGDPEPAITGDMLSEGMQLGTGRNSWAQVSWPNVTTRAWSESVFAIAPNQRLVYLLGGEILFNLSKHRKDKSDYVVWTKLLQARIRGTTVLLQSSPDTSRITVLEGTVDVMNRLDRSVIRLTPGGVYEVRTPKAKHTGDTKSIIDGVTTQRSPVSFVTPETARVLSMVDSLQQSLLGLPMSSSQTPIADGIHNLFLETLNVDELLGGLGLYDPLRSTLKSLREEIRSTINGLPLGETLLDTLNTTAEPLKTSTLGIRQTVGGVLDSVTSTLPDLEFKQILQSGNPGVPIFETLLSTTSLHIASKEGLLSHPLLTQFANPLESIPLINDALGRLDLPLVSDLTTGGGLLQNTSKVLSRTAEILRVPTATSYLIGQTVGSILPVPNGAFGLWTPVGLVGQTLQTAAGENGLLGTGLLSGVTAPVGSLANSLLTEGRASGGLLPLGGLLQNNNAALLPGVTLAPVTNTVNNIVAPVTNVTSSLTSTVTSTVSGLTGTLSNTTSNLTSTLNNVTSPLLGGPQPGGQPNQPVNQLLNGVLNLLH